MTNIVKTYQIFAATCKVLSRIDWLGNHNIHSVTEKDLQYIGKASNIEQYLKRFIEIIKDRVIKNVSNINTVRWTIKGFDETISLHLLMREVSKILDNFMKIELTKNIHILPKKLMKLLLISIRQLLLKLPTMIKLYY